MITKFRIYEAWKFSDLFSRNKNEPQKGDYVICRRIFAISSNDPKSKIDEFTNNNVGKIVKIQNIAGIKWYYVKFDNVPKELFGDHLEELNPMQRKNILYWSKDKDELESRIVGERDYNL